MILNCPLAVENCTPQRRRCELRIGQGDTDASGARSAASRRPRGECNHRNRVFYQSSPILPIISTSISHGDTICATNNAQSATILQSIGSVHRTASSSMASKFKLWKLANVSLMALVAVRRTENFIVTLRKSYVINLIAVT